MESRIMDRRWRTLITGNSSRVSSTPMEVLPRPAYVPAPFEMICATDYQPSISELLGPTDHTDYSQPNSKYVHPLSGAENFVKHASWTAFDGSLVSWSCGSNLEVLLGDGSGQISWPFSITPRRFTDWCLDVGLSQTFLHKLVAKATMFEYQLHFRKASHSGSIEPTCIEVATSVFENDSLFCILRYDLSSGTARCLTFVKGLNDFKEAALDISEVTWWLERHRGLMVSHPLMILNVLLSFMQYRAHKYVRWVLEINSMESRLGVTRDAQYLKLGGYAEMSHDFTTMNADLAGIIKNVANAELSASTILDHAKSLQRLVSICEPPTGSTTSVFQEEISSTINRAELYLKQIKMVQTNLQSLQAVLYNRINKQDTQSMKTIAVVTLIFLPTTFISAIFSTGIFNFHGSEPADNPKTISKYGWVYLMLCLSITALTLVSWTCWYRWGRVWLEKLEFGRVHSKNDNRQSPPAR